MITTKVNKTEIALINKDITNISETDIPNDSVNIIFTDPPYPQKYVHLFHSLGKLANRCLKPNGSLLVMAGQAHLPQYLEILTQYIPYYWTLSYLTPGKSAKMFAKKIMVAWKPILWHQKGAYTGKSIYDVFKSPAPEKQFHIWGQSTQGVYSILKAFTKDQNNLTILDPFLGGGSTLEAAIFLKIQKFIGIDIDPKAIETSFQRIQKIQSLFPTH